MTSSLDLSHFVTYNEDMTTIKFRKTKTGEWVVFGPTNLVKKGTVSVTKADGDK